jgi:prevent-host-death family protein
MKAIGLFEAKTKFSEICDTVAAKGVAVVITRRGKPLVRIEPVRSKTKPKGVWDYRADFVKTNGPLTEDFALPPRQEQAWRNPLDE